MASDNEATCESDPNFAVICAFMEKFGGTCGLASIDFLGLQEMLENTQEVPQELIDLHIKLLRKSRKTVSNERWEKAVIKFCHGFCVQDAWEIERFGYKKARLSSKLRVLKELLEMQFDYNARFKAEINKMSAEELRSQPLGKDKQGHAYWFQNDNSCQIRVYKEDPDEETWTLVAKDREGLVALINELSDGDSKISSESAINEEDSNSLAEKPIIDTGQVDSSSDSNKKISTESENSDESKDSTKKEENISPQETEAQTDENEDQDNGLEEQIQEEKTQTTTKRSRESDDEESEDLSKKFKAEEVSEAIEEPLMLVKGKGSGQDNECVNPIVGEEIEEDMMFFYGEGSGKDCQTGNEDKSSESKTSDCDKSTKKDAGDSELVSISDSKNCVNSSGSSKEVPTSPVKSPYKLGTIIDTKTDNKFFSTVRSSTKKSRWDVETIIAKEPETVKEDKEIEPPKKPMFFFGPGCLQFKPATVAFAQKVPQEKTEDLEVLPTNAKGDIGYRIEESGGNEETRECVQSGGSNEETTIEPVVDRLEEENAANNNKEQTKVEEARPICERDKEEQKEIEENVEKQIICESETENNVEVETKASIPEVTFSLVECEEETKKETTEKEQTDELKSVPVIEETCIKKQTYVCGEEKIEERLTVVENHEVEKDMVVPSPDKVEEKKEDESEKSAVVKSEEEEQNISVLDNENNEENRSEEKQKLEDVEVAESKVEETFESEVSQVTEKKEESTKVDEIENVEDSKNEENPNESKDQQPMIEEIEELKAQEEHIEEEQTASVEIKDNESTKSEEIEIVEAVPVTNEDAVKMEEAHELEVCDNKQEEKNVIPEKETETNFEELETVSKLESASEEIKESENEMKISEIDKKEAVVKLDQEPELKEEEEEDAQRVESKEIKNIASVSSEDEHNVETHCSMPLLCKEETNDVESESTKTDRKETNETGIEDGKESSKDEIEDSKQASKEEMKAVEVEERKQASKEEITVVEEKDNKQVNKDETKVEMTDIRQPDKEEIQVETEDNQLSKKETEEVKLEDTKASNKEETKESTPVVGGKRGRRNNSSDQTTEEDKKPRIATRRTTRSAKNGEKQQETVIEELPPRKPRGRAAQKAEKEETTDGDSKKMKMSPEETQEEPEKKTRGANRQKEVEKTNIEVKGEEKESKEDLSVPGGSPKDTETVIVESSSSSDVVELPDRDPLAVSEEESKEEQEEEKSKPMSLANFSLDFNDSPPPTPPVTRSGLRKRGRESPQNAEDNEESAGKRPKMKQKRAVDIKLRKSIEEQKKQELVSSDDDNKNEDKGAKKKKKDETPKTEETVLISSDAEKDAEQKPKKKKSGYKNKRLLSNLGIDPEKALGLSVDQPIGVRQSRRIAQLKIKEEAERRKLEEEMALDVQKKKKKSKKSEDKDYKVEKKRLKQEADDEEEAQDEDSADSKKKKKKKKKHRKLFDELNPWRSSSDSSSSEEEDEEIQEEEDDDEVLQFVSDHEFSPESDLEGEGEAAPLKRARTARKESDVEEVDDCPCQKCGKSDHPEWILLCDRCDNGWHCSCLRPPLLVIPEGDWFCPPCQHVTLLQKLQVRLKEYDKVLHKKELEDRRKERLAYVGISLNSVLPSKDTENIKKRKITHKDLEKIYDEESDEDEVSSDDESESGSKSSSESASDSDEPIYQLRQRRQAHSYRFNDYDELINSAIQDEMEAVKGAGNQGRGKDIATIVNAEKEEERKKEEVTEEQPPELEPLPPVVPINEKDKEAKPLFSDDEPLQAARKKIIGRKKHRKLNSLDISSEDDDEGSDEDFKGTSSDGSDDDFEEDLGSEDSDDLDTGRGRKKGSEAVRRSTRARTSRYDADFIDDGDSDYEDEAPRRKKKRSIWDESESEESDRSWGRRKRKPASRPKKTSITPSKKKKSKKKKKDDDSDAEVYKKKKPKIKFGLDGNDEGPGRRTRGKKINYVDALGSDSDEDRVKRPPPRIESDEEYVADGADEDDKISEEEADSGEEKTNPKAPKVQIQSYTDARFTQLLPEPKGLQEDGEGELNPIDQINRNVEMMDENEMEKMMEEEEYATKQLQMMAQQLEKEKRRKEREAKKLDGAGPQQPILQQQLQDPKKRPRMKITPKGQFQFSGGIQEPLVGNVDNLIVNSENNDELSEPPGVSLPLFAELGTGGEGMDDPSKKRRGKNKKSLEEAVANLGTNRQHQQPAPAFMPLGDKALPTDLSAQEGSNIEIAAPPQPFSQSQPTPSVITRMLQTKPGQPGYPIGTIRPKQFAAMPDREEDVHHSMSPTPAHHGQYVQGAGIRPQLSSPYRQIPPTLNNYPRNPPPQIRNPIPQLYHSHRPLDPSPSGGGTINMADHSSPGRVVSPAASSPGSNKNETPPPPYSRPVVAARFPMISTTSAGPRHTVHMVAPHLHPPRPNLSPYHPGLPPTYPHYGQFGEDAMPPTVYQGSPYSGEQFDGQVNPSENSNSKSFDEESGGEFGGLVSYFSSQREDDLES